MTNIFDQMAKGDADESSETFVDEALPPVYEDLEASQDGAAQESNSTRTPTEVKEVIQELLKHGFLEESKRPELFRRSMVYQQEIALTLEPLDLTMRLDTHRGLAFLAIVPSSIESSITQEDDEGWAHPLVRRQRLTLEQSLLIAILRQAFVRHEQESGVGQQVAKIAVDDLLPQFMTYLGDTGSDTKNESRLLNLLDQLKTYGIVSEVDKKHEVTIRPLIAHLASPESLAALLAVLKEQAQAAKLPESDA